MKAHRLSYEVHRTSRKFGEVDPGRACSLAERDASGPVAMFLDSSAKHSICKQLKTCLIHRLNDDETVYILWSVFFTVKVEKETFSDAMQKYIPPYTPGHPVGSIPLSKNGGSQTGFANIRPYPYIMTRYIIPCQ